MTEPTRTSSSSTTEPEVASNTAVVLPARAGRSAKRGRRARKWIARAAIVTLVGAAAAGVVFSLRPKPVPVDVAQVARGGLDVTLEEDGRTRVRARFVVSAPLMGRVLRASLRAGDAVEQGQVVATMLPQDAPLLDARSRAEAEARVSATSAGVQQADAAVERARVAADLARDELARIRTLAEGNAIGRAELDRAEGQMRLRDSDATAAKFAAQVARHEEALARAVVTRAATGTEAKRSAAITITSPVRGRVLRVLQESEGIIMAGQPLLEIGDPTNLEAVVDVLSSDATALRPGQEAVIEGWGGPPLPARVRLVEPSARTKLSALGIEEQRVDVVLDLEGDTSSLGDGYRVEARIVTDHVADALLVPAGATFRDRDGFATFVIDADARARRRTFEIVARGARAVAVRGDLAPGERLILHPSDRVHDGAAVTPR